MDLTIIPQVAGVYYFKQYRTEKLYIGSSINMRSRIKRHIAQLNAGTHNNPNLQAVWGPDTKFKIGVFEIVHDVSKLRVREQFYIDKYMPTGICFNVNPTADGFADWAGRKHTEESKKRMSRALRGKKHSEETKKKMSESRKNPSAETRAKLSVAAKGKKHPPRSEEFKQRMSVIAKNRTFSEETRRKMSETRTGKKKRPLTEEQKANISRGRTGISNGPFTEEHKRNLSESLSRSSRGRFEKKNAKAKS